MNDSTWAGITSNALEMLKGGVQELSTMIKDMAPELWEILITKIVVEAYAEIFTIVGFTLFSWTITYFLYKWYVRGKLSGRNSKCANCELYSLPPIIMGVVSFISSCVMFVEVKSNIIILMNPEYYAIQELMNLL